MGKPGRISTNLSYWIMQLVCKKGDQTIDDLLYQHTLLQTHKELLKRNVLNNGNWHASKQELITKHRK
jgi:hypothetical protein